MKEQSYAFNIDKDSFNKMLIESETFRKTIIERFYFIDENEFTKDDGLDLWRKWVKKFFPNYKNEEKIKSILWLIKILRNEKSVLNQFENAGFERNGTSISIHAAKRFINSID
jgi:hypothetical protein